MPKWQFPLLEQCVEQSLTILIMLLGIYASRSCLRVTLLEVGKVLLSLGYLCLLAFVTRYTSTICGEALVCLLRRADAFFIPLSPKHHVEQRPLAFSDKDVLERAFLFQRPPPFSA